MECRDVQMILSARADGEASPEEIRLSDEHLELCGHCRRTDERLRRLAGTVARSEGLVPSEFREKLFARLEREELLPARRSLFAFSYRWAAIPAALAAGVVVFLLTSREPVRAPLTPTGESVQVARGVPEPATAPPAGNAEPAAGEKASRPSPAPAVQGRAAAESGGDLSQEDREIVANLDVLEGTPDLEGNGGLDEIDLLLPSEKDRG